MGLTAQFSDTAQWSWSGLVAAGMVIVGLVMVKYMNHHANRLAHIPAMGYSSPAWSYLSALKFLNQQRTVLKQGYIKYPDQTWRFPSLEGWYIVANGGAKAEEMSKAGDDILSAEIGFSWLLQLDHTLGPEVTLTPYHNNVVRGVLTRNIQSKFQAMHHEIQDAVSELFSGQGEWIEVHMSSTALDILSRVFVRVCVGESYGENMELRSLCGRSGTAMLDGRKLHLFPSFLRPIASRFVSTAQCDIIRVGEILDPIIQSRLSAVEEVEKPNDILAWLMEEAERIGTQTNIHDLAARIYFLATSSQNASMVLTSAFQELLGRPAYIEVLREEVEAIVKEEGWSKVGVSKMHKVDSFLRETLRCYDGQPLHLAREVLQDFVFSDGTVIPKGSAVFSNSFAIHRDESVYRDAYTFDGFRFLDIVNERDDGGARRRQLMKPTLEYYPFGYGKHACPGRFFASYELKLMLAYLVTHCDIKRSEVLPSPPVWVDGDTFRVDYGMRVMFRRRQEVVG